MRYIILILFILSSVPLSVMSKEISKIIAKVNNQVITSQDLEDYCRVLAYRNNEHPENIDLNDSNFRKTSLNRLVEDRLILGEAKKEEIKVPKSVIDENFKKMVNAYKTNEDFEKSLLAKGLNITLLKERIKEQYLMRQAINQNIRAFITISPQEISSYYQNNNQEFVTPEGYVFYIAKSDNSAYLEEILQAVNSKGLNFALAEYASDLMQLESTKDKLKPELAECLEGLSEGQCKVTKVEKNFYIICLEEQITARFLTLNEAKEIINSYLGEVKFKQEFQKWIGKLKEKSVIEEYYE